jgi:hypothetical protein
MRVRTSSGVLRGALSEAAEHANSLHADVASHVARNDVCESAHRHQQRLTERALLLVEAKSSADGLSCKRQVVGSIPSCGSTHEQYGIRATLG